LKALVTGGAGFIASHLADRLIESGHQVVVVDDLSKGRAENLNPKATFHRLDIGDPALADVFAAERPEAVFHHAAHVDVTRSVADPMYDASVNIMGSLNLLECCRAHDVRKFVYASSGGALYGEPVSVPADEHHPVVPFSPYGVSKYVVEQYLYFYHLVHGLDYTVLRYANVYGPRQDPLGEAGVVAVFSVQLLKGDQPVIFGDGSKTRDYCYVADVVEANLLALNDKSGGVYNLGRGIEVTDLELYETVRQAIDSKTKPVFKDFRPGEVVHSALDASKAETELGWKWRTELKDGIAKSVDYYRTTSERAQT